MTLIEPLCLYIKVRDGKVEHTVTHRREVVHVDYDGEGNVVGVEVLLDEGELLDDQMAHARGECA